MSDIQAKLERLSYVEVEQTIAQLQAAVREQYQKAEYDEAMKSAQECLMVCECHFSLKHPVTASALNNIALLYKQMGDLHKAADSYMQALNIYREVVEKESQISGNNELHFDPKFFLSAYTN